MQPCRKTLVHVVERVNSQSVQLAKTSVARASTSPSPISCVTPTSPPYLHKHRDRHKRTNKIIKLKLKGEPAKEGGVGACARSLARTPPVCSRKRCQQGTVLTRSAVLGMCEASEGARAREYQYNSRRTHVLLSLALAAPSMA